MTKETGKPNTPIMEELQDQDLDQVNGGGDTFPKLGDLGKGNLKMGKQSLEAGFGDLGFTGKGRTAGAPLGYTENDSKGKKIV